MPSTSRMLTWGGVGGPPPGWHAGAVADGPVDLVGEHDQVVAMAISAIASQSSRVSALPHGLCGELRSAAGTAG